MESKKLKRDLVILLISSFIVIVCWIGFNIYSKAVTSTIDESLTKQITPIEPSFDEATINKLTGREKIEPLYQSEGIVSPTPIPEEETPPVPTLFEEQVTEEVVTQSITPAVTIPTASGAASLP